MFYRDIEKELETYIDCKQAIFILGARQVGKTTLIKRMMTNFPESNRYYFDLEKMSDKKVFEGGVQNLLSFLEFHGLDLKTRNYIFVDEIQYLKDFSNLLKLLVDYHSDSIKLFLSGSSSVQIQTGFQDSLAGRKYIFNLFPLTFREFLLFRGKDHLYGKLNRHFFDWKEDELRFGRDELLPLLYEFLLFGGYPEVAKIDQFDRKVKYLTEIVNAYIVKDIRTMFTIEKIDKFNHLVRYLAANIANLLSIHSLATEVGIYHETILNYLNILEESFIVKRIPPFFQNKSTELKKSSKLFFIDNGIRNAVLENFQKPEFRTDTGALAENFAFSQLYKTQPASSSLHFWRTRAKNEIDFVLNRQGELLPIEIKSKIQKQQKILSQINLFRKEYQCPAGYIVSIRDEFSTQNDIRVLPAYLLT